MTDALKHTLSKQPSGVLFVLPGAVMLCAPAFYNNFPFLFADTGTYISAGFQGAVSEMRPILYGIFIRHASLMESLWLVVFLQAVMVSWVIHAFFRVFSKQPVGIWPLAVIFLLTLVTGIGITTGMLMPDFLAAVMILCGAMLLYGEHLSVTTLVACSLLLWFALASHHSNAYIFAGLLLMIGGIRWVKRLRRLPQPAVRRVPLVLSVLVAGYFTIPTVNWAQSGEFYWSKAGPIFLTGRVHQMGLLVPFLNEKCGAHNYRLCEFKDILPDDLLWAADSPLPQTGGWGPNAPLNALMLRDFFSTPLYLKKFCIKSLESAVMQFFTFEGKIVYKEQEWGYPFQVIQNTLPEYIPAIKRSRQYWDEWNDSVMNVLQRFAVYGSFLGLLYAFVFQPHPAIRPLHRQIAGFIILALVANAVVCGCLSMVDMRFQFRVVWLVPLLVVWLVKELEVVRLIKTRS